MKSTRRGNIVASAGIISGLMGEWQVRRTRIDQFIRPDLNLYPGFSGGALLGAVSGKPKDEVDRSLQRLVASEIVLPIGPAPDDAYAFRHALIQDAAYQSLLLSRRRQCHGEIASALERQFPEMIESQPDLVAR